MIGAHTPWRWMWIGAVMAGAGLGAYAGWDWLVATEENL